MKELRHNMRLIGALVVVAFVGLSAWFALTVFEQGGIWASTSYNTRLNASGAFRGDILDRNGETLATTVDGQRVYADSAAARRASFRFASVSCAIASSRKWRAALPS